MGDHRKDDAREDTRPRTTDDGRLSSVVCRPVHKIVVVAVLVGLLCTAMGCQTEFVFVLPTLTALPPTAGIVSGTAGGGEAAHSSTLVPILTPEPADQAVRPTAMPPTETPEPGLGSAPTPRSQPTPDQGATPAPTETPLPETAPLTFSFVSPELTPMAYSGADTTAVPTPVQQPMMADDTINILVLGSDRRPTWDDWNTDVVQVVSIQPSVPAITVLSIPRDLYIYIPGFWMSRVNRADLYGEIYDYPGGGPALVRQTLLYNLGIPIHVYVRTDFQGFIGIVDTLGGVDIPVHCRLQDYWPEKDASGTYPIKVLEPGYHRMDGETALWYARSRKTTSVFSREKRQQQVLYAIWQKARSGGFLSRVPELWYQLNQMVVTDIQLADVLKLADVALRLNESNVRFRNIGAQQVIPWTTPGGGAVLLPDWDRVGPVVADALAPIPQGRLDRALQAVEVWNGTARDHWDILAADRLLREGYAVVIGEPDRTDYSSTVLVDFTTTSKGSALPYLQELFDITEANIVGAPDPSSPVRYRIIIGEDYVTCPAP